VLVHSGAAHVHACEWNPEAVLALDRNLEANGVAGRCTVHVGDNRVTSRGLSGVADRVLLGLLPSAEEGYAPALGVLRPEGGELHVHGLGEAGGHGAWAERVEASLGAIEPGCSLERLAITRVKSHAPHWDHLVLDVRVSRA
jgi:tRNA G37 N-methylase Trm5